VCVLECTRIGEGDISSKDLGLPITPRLPAVWTRLFPFNIYLWHIRRHNL